LLGYIHFTFVTLAVKSITFLAGSSGPMGNSVLVMDAGDRLASVSLIYWPDR
jgi:hypothetical protein